MRYITPHILDDLKRKMVFVGGPRQVGKTTLAKAIFSSNYPDGKIPLLAVASFHP
ncbi:MAG: hypothetical protein JRD71_07025 [Deltaproteobacteria bacterium]|nr:hypothetical protein [Deltaproteobacteria bacterium]